MKLTPKKYSGILILIIIPLLSSAVVAQDVPTPDTYFHDGARAFIGNNIPAALDAVNQGIAQFPDDPKLNALLERIKEEQEKQQQQQNQNQENQQDEQQEQEQQNQQEQDQQSEEEQNEQQQDQQNQNQDEQNPENQQEQQQQMMPKEISKEEADKILQALAQKEKELLKEFKKQKPQGSSTHEKDW